MLCSVLSAAVLAVVCVVTQEEVGRLERRFTEDIDRRLDLVDPLETFIVEERSRFSVLRPQSRSVTIGACIATFVAILVAATYKDGASDQAEVTSATTMQLGFVLGPIMLTFAYWVHRAWANLEPLGVSSAGISAGEATARVILPVRSAFRGTPVLTRLWRLSSSPGRTPAVVLGWWLCLVVAWAGTLLNLVLAMEQAEGHVLMAYATAGASVGLAWVSVYLAYTIQERQIVSMLDILERQHRERSNVYSAPRTVAGSTRAARRAGR